MDPDNKTISLANLLQRIADDADDITRSWYVARHGPNPQEKQLAQEKFNQFAAPDCQHVERKKVEADLQDLKKTTQLIVRYLNNYIAHIAREPVAQVTYCQLDAAIDTVICTTNRYARLLLVHEAFNPIVPDDYINAVLTVAWKQ